MTANHQRIEGPKGIGGWLILPIIQLCLIALLNLATLAGINPSDYNGIEGIMTYDLLLATIQMILPVIALILIFNQKRIAITMVIITYASFVVFAWATTALLSVNGVSGDVVFDYAATALGVTAGNALWIVYFILSKRVKSTFTK